MRTLFGRTECNRVVAIVLLLLVGAAFASAQEHVRNHKERPLRRMYLWRPSN